MRQSTNYSEQEFFVSGDSGIHVRHLVPATVKGNSSVAYWPIGKFCVILLSLRPARCTNPDISLKPPVSDFCDFTNLFVHRRRPEKKKTVEVRIIPDKGGV